MKIKLKNIIKIGYMNPNNIIKGIFSVGTLYFIILIINRFIELFLFVNSGVPATSTFAKVGSVIYWSGVCIKPLLGIVLFKFLCEILYKILELIIIYIKKNS